MSFTIEDLPNATGYETSAHDMGRSLATASRYAVEDLFFEGLWLPIEGVWAGGSYGASELDTIMYETNEAAALAIIDGYDEDVAREYHAGYWWVQVMDSEGVVNDTARGVLDEIAEALANYPLLDEDAFCEREYEETAENLECAVKDELRNAAPGEWDEWDEIATAAGVDLVVAIIGHEDFEYDSEDCWPTFPNCSVLEIASEIVAELIATNANAAARAAHVEVYGDDPNQRDLF